MKFKLYKTFGALNSPPIFSAIEQGIQRLGHEVVEYHEDISVIWSVLWHGRMQANHQIYKNSLQAGKPVMIIEVGNLKRGTTWRISLNNINSLGVFANLDDLDISRPEKLGVKLSPIVEKRNPSILIAAQHGKSLQWEGMPSMEQWVKSTISKIRERSSRNIIVRPHPRWPFRETFKNVVVELPKKLPNTYDSFDISYRYHCVINHNSGPAVQAAIAGVPVICDPSNLAGPISESWENLENPQLPDRDEWFMKLCHTEWTVDEISQGIPLARILKYLEKNS